MHIGRRGIEAVAVLLVVLMILGVLLPLTVQAASQITGTVVRCQAPQTPVIGAIVTLVDVNGIAPPRTATANTAGVYTFAQPTPPPASYTVSAERSGYYPNQTTTPVRFDGSQSVTMPTLCLWQHGTPPSTLSVTVTNGPSNPVAGASVSAYQETNPTGRVQLVTRGTTGNNGVVNLTVWDATFKLRTSAAELPTAESTVTVTGTTSFTVDVSSVPVQLFGQVRNASGFVAGGVVAWLYNPAAPASNISRLIPATVRDSYYQFEDARVPDGPTYTLIIDADGHLSSREQITITPGPLPQHDVILQEAPRERYETTILYGSADWNNLTSWRNLTLNADSTLPGLGPPDLRDLRLQIDATLGNGDGTLDPVTEIPAFQPWLASKGPAYVTTDGFFTTNGKSYNSTLSTFSVTVSPTLTVPNARVWINATVQYTVKDAPPFITTGAKSYDVTMTVVPDADRPAYKDNVYLVQVPRSYEMNNSATDIVPDCAPIAATNFTRFTVDPGVMPTTGCATPWQSRMKVEQSLHGTARARAIAPPGKFHEANTDFRNYEVFVPNNTEITYSAATSFHPIQPPCNLNFTWVFTPPPQSDTRWGCEVKFTYTRSERFIVNLTMRDGSDNLTYRNFTVFVDGTPPVAQIRTDRTGSGNANGTTLRVDEGVPVRFDGTFSTDLAFPGKDGVIARYAWDFDGNGTVDDTRRTVTHTFDRPGVFQVSLAVTDGVGWKAVNATLTARVNDTTPPVPAFDILDPGIEWAVITSPMEKKTIWLNASKTTDEFYEDADLEFNWTIHGPVSVGGTLLEGPTHPFSGVNVTFAWDAHGSYDVVLSVRDNGGDGTGGGQPNWGNLTRSVTVQIDAALHADLRVSIIEISTTDPEEGTPVTISVNVTNKAGRLTASQVTVEVSTRPIGGDPIAAPVNSVRWFKGAVETTGTDETIPADTTVRIELVTQFSGSGNRTLEVKVRDSTEPDEWLGDNSPTRQLNVRPPWWQPYVIVAAVIAIVALAVFGMYARRKIKAGEWRPIRGRRGERGGAEERERPRREVKEEKKRL